MAEGGIGLAPARNPGPRAFRGSGARGPLMDQHTQAGLEPLASARSFQAIPLGNKGKKMSSRKPIIGRLKPPVCQSAL